MQKKIRWAVLGAAKIAREKVVPAMLRAEACEVLGFASRDLERAQAAGEALGLSRAWGSYEEMLADPEVDAVYNPLPNHLHVSLSIQAAAAGKHVLCEKPIAMSAAETELLIAARDRYGVKIGEAFMARTHPQWLRALELVRSGAIGELRAIAGFFSYNNRDPKNIRNSLAMGGGAMMDIGCYPVTLSRMMFGVEPLLVSAMIERHADFGTDILSSVLLQYPQGHCVFTASTQIVPYQRIQLLGTKARIEVEIPFNAPVDRPCRLLIDEGGNPLGSGVRVEELPVADQYTIQGELFSRAILDDGEVPVSLEDGLANMKCIEAIFESARTGTFVNLNS
jgi:predicted dehydrogenase